MATSEITLALRPAQRFSITDVNHLLREEHGDFLDGFSRALYTSFHTTAGYLEQHVCRQLAHSRDGIHDFVRAYQKLYPAGAGYRHDQLEHRDELTEEQKVNEPLNGDSHLTFIGTGLLNCVTYDVKPGAPAFFVDLDGVFRSQRRTRKTTVTGYTREVVAEERTVRLPASRSRVDAFNLRDTRLGFLDELDAHIRRIGITKGRIDLRLSEGEKGAALTVNEYETLLMRHDLAEVIRNPFRFVAEQGWHVLRDPRSVPSKALNYAKYDFVLVVNRMLDRLGLRGTSVEQVADRLIGGAAARRLHMKRAVSLPISDNATPGIGRVLHGTYQSPILIQWKGAAREARSLDVRFVAFE